MVYQKWFVQIVPPLVSSDLAAPHDISTYVHTYTSVCCPQMTIESVNARVMEKTRELNSVQIENEKLKVSCTPPHLQPVVLG